VVLRLAPGCRARPVQKCRFRAMVLGGVPIKLNANRDGFERGRPHPERWCPPRYVYAHVCLQVTAARFGEGFEGRQARAARTGSERNREASKERGPTAQAAAENAADVGNPGNTSENGWIWPCGPCELAGAAGARSGVQWTSVLSGCQ
jgi:hypothetical protein